MSGKAMTPETEERLRQRQYEMDRVIVVNGRCTTVGLEMAWRRLERLVGPDKPREARCPDATCGWYGGER